MKQNKPKEILKTSKIASILLLISHICANKSEINTEFVACVKPLSTIWHVSLTNIFDTNTQAYSNTKVLDTIIVINNNAF